jgi:hypothetical protein
MLAMPRGRNIEALHQRLRHAGVPTRRSYALDPAFSAGLSIAPDLGPRLIELPSHSRMAESEVAAICRIVLALATATESAIGPCLRAN